MQAKHFRDYIRQYNSAFAFAFASFGGNIDKIKAKGPYCFHIHGQIYHQTGCLHPSERNDHQYRPAQNALSCTYYNLPCVLIQYKNNNFTAPQDILHFVLCISRAGCLHPSERNDHQYGQLYILEGGQAIASRMKIQENIVIVERIL